MIYLNAATPGIPREIQLLRRTFREVDCSSHRGWTFKTAGPCASTCGLERGTIVGFDANPLFASCHGIAGTNDPATRADDCRRKPQCR